jgi:hypothetical protein
VSFKLQSALYSRRPWVALFLCAVLSTGCAVGPLVQHETARSVGKGDHELIAGYGQAGYVLKWNAGVTENFDFGVHWESLSFGVRGKYSIINGRSGGLSLAGAIGAGSSLGGNHHYGDLMVSYLSGFFEPYATGRFVQVSTDPVEFRNADTGQTAFTVSSAQYNYGQVIVGSRFWLGPNWMLSIEGSNFFAMGDGITISGGAFFGAGLGVRF